MARHTDREALLAHLDSQPSDWARLADEGSTAVYQTRGFNVWRRFYIDAAGSVTREDQDRPGVRVPIGPAVYAADVQHGLRLLLEAELVSA